MSGASKDLDELEAGTSGMMEGEEYYNPEGSEWSQKVDTGQLCRVCANPNEYLIPIFDGEGLEHKLGMKIQKHLPIKVTETDSLPQQMCYQCASTLIAWHDLVISCVEADKKLRELHAEEDDDDHKGPEMFESPSLDSEMTDDAGQPSTSETQNRVSKTASLKKVTVSKEKKPKLKMVLVKGPPASTSGQKTASKTQVVKALELAKSKDAASRDSASERCHQSSVTSFRAFQETKNAMGNTVHLKGTTAPASDLSNAHSIWIKTENISPEICDYCGSLFNHKSDLLAHLVKVHSEHVFQCEVCDSVFKSKDIYGVHIKLHESSGKCFQEVSETCSNSSGHGSDPNDDTCVSNESEAKDSRILNVKSAVKFEIVAKPPEQNSLVCRMCGKHFKRLYHLNKHTKTHNMILKVEADESEAVMSGSDSEEEVYNEDESKMEGEATSGKKEKIKKAYRCEMCGKNFALKDSYKSHQRIHTGEKPFTCHICGKQFSHTGGLYYHLKHVHAGIKNHSCDICGRSFALKAAMEDHRRIHTGERPYVCHTCGKSFKTWTCL